MKYCILFFLCIVNSLNAQFEPERYMGATFALEDMSNPYGPPSFGPNQKGIYFWRPPDEWYFTSTMSRVSDEVATNGNGYVSFISTHTAKSYHPVGVSFGEDANSAGIHFGVVVHPIVSIVVNKCMRTNGTFRKCHIQYSFTRLGRIGAGLGIHQIFILVF